MTYQLGRRFVDSSEDQCRHGIPQADSDHVLLGLAQIG